MHDFLKKPKRRHVKEIPLAPILDLLTVVIFFLILSTSFIELRQNILPPSSTISTESKPETTENKIPLNPKLIMLNKNHEVIINLSWTGETPAQLTKKFKESNLTYNHDLKINVQNIIKDFKNKFPNEKALQIGWQGNLNYQAVLNVIDGAIIDIKDIVLISPEEVEKLYLKVQP